MCGTRPAWFAATMRVRKRHCGSQPSNCTCNGPPPDPKPCCAEVPSCTWLACGVCQCLPSEFVCRCNQYRLAPHSSLSDPIYAPYQAWRHTIMKSESCQLRSADALRGAANELRKTRNFPFQCQFLTGPVYGRCSGVCGSRRLRNNNMEGDAGHVRGCSAVSLCIDNNFCTRKFTAL